MRALVEVPSLSLCALQQPGTHSFAYSLLRASDSFGRSYTVLPRGQLTRFANRRGSTPRVSEQNIR